MIQWRSAFRVGSPYKKGAKCLAIAWTLLLFLACFIPGNEIPDVKIPLIDKWVHFVLFAVFSFLWLSAYPSVRFKNLFLVFFLSAILGWLVEFIQGMLTFLGRSQDNKDTLADAIGGLIGVVLFYLLAKAANAKQ